ncbi:MAG: SDR family oxidoreductase [Hyphomicrobiaceae bacterium]
MPRKIVITGGSGGIGSAICRRFLASGDYVVNLDREPFSTADPEHLVTVACNLADAASIGAAFRQADTHFDKVPVDVLVCCAAVSRAAHFLDVPMADLETMLDVNVRGTFLCGQEAGRRMRARGQGHIVVVTSIAGQQAWARESVYCLTKAAQSSLVQGMAIELAPFGIMVNAVAPGIIDVESKGMAGTRDGEVYRHEMERFPLGRFGRPEEIAEAVHHLSGVTWMAGQTIYADGGFLATGLAYFGEAKDRLLKSYSPGS